MTESYEYLREQMSLANEGRISGQQAYSALIDNYGFITIDSFVDVLTDSYGYANLLACRIAQWILDWFRPTTDGKPRFSGTLFFPSRQLASELNVSEKSFKSARAVIRDAGIAKFVTRGHRCEVSVDWIAVLDAIETYSMRGSDGTNRDSLDTSDGTNRDSLDTSDGTNRDSLRGPDGTNRYPIPPLVSSFKESSFLRADPHGSRKEEDVEKSGLREVVDRCLEYGRTQGRSCSGRWESDAHDAFQAAVREEGRDPTVIETAWRDYVVRLAHNATDLGHWIRGLNLRGEPCDEGNDSFQACYARAEAEAARAAERARVAAGGVPTPRFAHTSDGWVVSAEGVPGQHYSAVASDATLAEALAAWPDWWRNLQNSR